MSYIALLFLSAICINGVHSYLLVSQRTNRKFTISEHAAKHRNTLALYQIGHVLGGTFFLLFARYYYLDTVQLPGLFWLAVFSVMFEYIQSFLPARGVTNTAHTITALIMWMSFVLLGLLTIVFVPALPARKVAATVSYALLLAALVFAYNNRQHIYRYQMAMIALLFISLLILII